MITMKTMTRVQNFNCCIMLKAFEIVTCGIDYKVVISFT